MYVEHAEIDTLTNPATFFSPFQEALSFGYNVFVWEQTSNHDILLNAKPDSVLYKLFQERMKDRDGAFVNGIFNGQLFYVSCQFVK